MCESLKNTLSTLPSLSLKNLVDVLPLLYLPIPSILELISNCKKVDNIVKIPRPLLNSVFSNINYLIEKNSLPPQPILLGLYEVLLNTHDFILHPFISEILECVYNGVLSLKERGEEGFLGYQYVENEHFNKIKERKNIVIEKINDVNAIDINDIYLQDEEEVAICILLLLLL